LSESLTKAEDIAPELSRDVYHGGARRLVRVAFLRLQDSADRRGTRDGTFRYALGLCHLMIQLTRDLRTSNLPRIGSQPIALAAATLLVILAGAAAIGFWRLYLGASPELDRAAATRQLQARTAQASEQLVEKTSGLQATQQESIDQLQMIQDQLQTMRRLLAAQQADTKRLSDQVSGLTEAVDGLRQSFASAQPSEPSSAPASRNSSLRARAHADLSSAHHKRGKSRS
jgi:hypothetical protein